MKQERFGSSTVVAGSRDGVGARRLDLDRCFARPFAGEKRRMNVATTLADDFGEKVETTLPLRETRMRANLTPCRWDCLTS